MKHATPTTPTTRLKRPKPRLTALALLTATLAATLTAAAAARAATYTVDACQHPDGAYVPADGWVPGVHGAYVYTRDGCGSGGGLEATWDSAVAHNADDFALWGFAAPTGTKLRWLVASRAASIGPNQPYGTPQALLLTDHVIETCDATVPCSSRNGVLSADLGNAESLTFGIHCAGASGCPAGAATTMSMRQIELTLVDDASPVLVGAPAGTLMSAGTRMRQRALTYQASDVGGGVYRQRLLADGVEIAAGVVDGNDGKCSKYGKSFSHRVPCKLSASGSLSLDTAKLSDGDHELGMEVYDATGVNKATYGPWPIVADTRPPAISAIAVTGTPRAGEALRGAATVDGQSPAITYQWLRAAADGSDPRPITSATGETYHLTTADVGHKILLQVKATDGGGTADRTTSATDPPFAGKVVAECENQDACRQAAAANAQAPGTVALANPITSAGSNGNPADPQAVVTARFQRGGGSRTRTTSRLVAPFNSRVRIRGAITTQAGTPIRDARVVVVEKRLGAPETAWKATSQAVSRRDGTLTAFTSKGGRSRELRLVYFPQGASDANRASNLLSLLVRQDARLRLSRRNLRNGQTLRFRGTVRGTIPAAGALVQLQVKLRTGWFTFKRLTVGRRSAGRFAARYTFRRTTSRTRYRFRVKVVPRNSSSYATGYSAAHSVIVRP